MSKIYSVTSRKLTKRDFKDWLHGIDSQNLMGESARLVNEFPMYTQKIMEAVGEVAAKKAAN